MTVAGVTITNPGREVFPEIHLTKEALAEFYEAVAPLMLPHIRGRPISSVRCPQGRAGECFFQKHWPPKGGAKISTKPVAEGDGEPEPYAFATTARDLVALVQHGVIETHIWGSRFDDLDKPDRLVLDLDPGPGMVWRSIKGAAFEVRELFHSLGLKSWVKLTGGKGIHVVVPVDRRVDWGIVNGFGKAAAERLMRDNPKLYVAKAAKVIRDKKIFVDWMRNSRGATYAAPWCARAREGAPVSVPLHWDELESIKKPDQYSIPRVMKMIANGQEDPWNDMLTKKQRLTSEMAMQLLAEGA
ncbi:MAG: DNA polymerase domain-containing protein [Phycisphaerae bacterium]|nr:DNA polymerase domain-containing protein [Gemmatimonadaceae bacterium]